MSFELELDQYKKLDVWRQEHETSCPIFQDPEVLSGHKNPGGAIGGMYTYCFTPTGIGTIERVKCNGCSAEIDLTRYEDW
jgi:hypothetical protein